MGALKEISDEIEEKYKKKGFYNKQIRAMIVGIPNAGKSTFINNISKRKGTATGDKPGVTKAKQWIKVKNNIDMLDTPGILWPKIETDEQGYKLAATGAIREEILNKADIAAFILEFMKKNYPENLRKKYNLSDMSDIHEMMNDIGIKNGCLLKGNEIDMERVTRLIISDFRKGRLGKITMERP
jgi:ribosome biogenesis GTPase A